MRRELEVMRVLRIPPLGKLDIEVDGKRYQNLSEITDEKVRRVLLAAIGELIDFAGNYQVLVDAGVAPALVGTTQDKPPVEQQQAEFLERLEKERDALKATPLPKPAMAVLSGAKMSEDEMMAQEAARKRPLSVAEQIDAILQKHLAAAPDMGERVVHLVQNPAGGILIEVDGQRFGKPADIPEPAIQELIKRAVKEWDAA
jgi:putative intracellular protease/amidase